MDPQKPVAMQDMDGDGYFEEDCDDADPEIHPNAAELCDLRDNNCNGQVDENPVDGGLWYEDQDQDGYGEKELVACSQPEGSSVQGGDCRDTDPDYHPGAEEHCVDSKDFNCDGSVAWADEDGDGLAACQDCNDQEATQHSGSIELCNGVDDNCDGIVDNDRSGLMELLADPSWEPDGDCGEFAIMLEDGKSWSYQHDVFTYAELSVSSEQWGDFPAYSMTLRTSYNSCYPACISSLYVTHGLVCHQGTVWAIGSNGASTYNDSDDSRGIYYAASWDNPVPIWSDTRQDSKACTFIIAFWYNYSGSSYDASCIPLFIALSQVEPGSQMLPDNS
jgi:hypothetical protein